MTDFNQKTHDTDVGSHGGQSRQMMEVFDEVLPSIRMHGVYMSDSILDQAIQHPEVIYTLAQEQEANQKRLQDLALMMRRTDEQESDVRTFIREIRKYAAIAIYTTSRNLALRRMSSCQANSSCQR